MMLCSFANPAFSQQVNHTSDASVNTDTTDRQRIQTNDDVTLTINAEVNFDGASAVIVQSGRSGATIIINSGGSVINTDTSTNNSALRAQGGTNVTITNSGLIQGPNLYAVNIGESTGATITNNAGGIIFSDRQAVTGTVGGNASDVTLTNNGTIYVTGRESTVNFTENLNVTITNNGTIYRESGATTTTGTAQSTIRLGSSSTLINSGEIRNDASQTLNAISLSGDGNTIILKIRVSSPV